MFYKGLGLFLTVAYSLFLVIGAQEGIFAQILPGSTILILLGVFFLYLGYKKNRTDAEEENKEEKEPVHIVWPSWKGFLFCFLVYSILFVVVVGVEQAQGRMPPEWVYPTILLGPFAVWMIYLNSATGRKKAAEKKLYRQQDKEIRQKSAELLKNTLFCSHMAGLPLAEGTACSLRKQGESLEIHGGGNTFRVGLDRITSAQVKTDVEIQGNYVSSAGGALGGALLFGTLGALVGGRVKKKTSRQYEYYIIITYSKDGSPNFLSFQVDDGISSQKFFDRLGLQKFIDRPTIEL